jgi:succinate dehydrogenase/fumarate reductase cytochrome b subunit
MKETKYWTWHMLAGVIILFLLGLHMITMHLNTILGLFNPFGGEAIEWANVAARGKLVIYALLGIALYHGLYGFRTILFELGLRRGTQRFINVLFVIVGICFFVIGTWAAIKFQSVAQVI